MRTTVRLDPHLLAEAEKMAAADGRTVTAVIEDALRESFGRQRHRHTAPDGQLPTFGGRGPLPGVDLNDSAGLLDLMEKHAGYTNAQTKVLCPGWTP